MAVNEMNFTKASLDALPLAPIGGRVAYHDAKTTGLQIRITSTGVKTFSVYRRLKGGPVERVTLGRYPNMSIEQARKESARINALISEGINPNTDVRALKTETTLKELYVEFLKHRRNKRGAYLADKTKRTYTYDS
jgi:Arm DNA-binding domain